MYIFTEETVITPSQSFSACTHPAYATCRSRPSGSLPHIRWQAAGGWGWGGLVALHLSLHPPPRPEGVCSPRPYFFAPTGLRQCHAYARWCRCDVYLYTAGLSNIKAATRTNEFLIALLMLAHRVVNHSRSRSFANEISCWKGWELPLSWRFALEYKSEKDVARAFPICACTKRPQLLKQTLILSSHWPLLLRKYFIKDVLGSDYITNLNLFFFCPA